MHKTGKVEIYRHNNRDWRWRAVAANGRIIASGEGFTRRAMLEKSLVALRKILIHEEIAGQLKSANL